MGFVCTAGNAEKSEPQLIGDSVVVPIGYDDVAPRSYSLLIAFDRTGGGDEEFFFCMIEANHDDNTETRYWSGLDVARFAPEADRKLIRTTLLAGTELLLRHKAPQRVFCCTHDSHLPEKALTKHLLVARIFETCGYIVEAQPLFLGKYSWWMERRDEGSH
jgi:hypothetical protein